MGFESPRQIWTLWARLLVALEDLEELQICLRNPPECWLVLSTHLILEGVPIICIVQRFYPPICLNLTVALLRAGKHALSMVHRMEWIQNGSKTVANLFVAAMKEHSREALDSCLRSVWERLSISTRYLHSKKDSTHTTLTTF
jgi:hypothetical protein